MALPEFKVSTFCNAGGCVAVAVMEDGVLVRSSSVDDSPVLSFSSEEWRAFLLGVRHGEFDLPSLGH